MSSEHLNLPINTNNGGTIDILYLYLEQGNFCTEWHFHIFHVVNVFSEIVDVKNVNHFISVLFVF